MPSLPLDASARIIALLDAFADCPTAFSSLQLHCSDGVTLAALHTWAGARDLPVLKQTRVGSTFTWDWYEVGDVTVHDTRSRRVNAGMEEVGL